MWCVRVLCVVKIVYCTGGRWNEPKRNILIRFSGFSLLFPQSSPFLSFWRFFGFFSLLSNEWLSIAEHTRTSADSQANQTKPNHIHCDHSVNALEECFLFIHARERIKLKKWRARKPAVNGINESTNDQPTGEKIHGNCARSFSAYFLIKTGHSTPFSWNYKKNCIWVEAFHQQQRWVNYLCVCVWWSFIDASRIGKC